MIDRKSKLFKNSSVAKWLMDVVPIKKNRISIGQMTLSCFLLFSKPIPVCCHCFGKHFESYAKRLLYADLHKIRFYLYRSKM